MGHKEHRSPELYAEAGRFEQGMVVQLRSGGAAMTVVEAVYDKPPRASEHWLPWVKCCWMDAVGCLHSASFDPHALKAY